MGVIVNTENDTRNHTAAHFGVAKRFLAAKLVDTGLLQRRPQ
jgi:hypothetical protein